MESPDLTRKQRSSEILDEGKFDMVFWIYHMASPDGIDLARQMRNSRFIV